MEVCFFIRTPYVAKINFDFMLYSDLIRYENGFSGLHHEVTTINFNNSKRCFVENKVNVNRSVVFFFILLVVAYIPVFMKEQILDAFVREDRIYETLSPIYLFVASIMFGIAFYRSPIKLKLKDPAWLKRLSFLAFCVLFLLATMEEISWGQRIFGVETPNLIKDVNVQKELTFHNLNIFQGEDAKLPLDFDQLSAIFALTFGFLIPAACRFIAPLKKFLDNKFPILPLLFGLLFPVNYLIQKTLMRVLPIFPDLFQHPNMRFPQAVYEVREHNYAMLLMASAVLYILLKLDLGNEKPVS